MGNEILEFVKEYFKVYFTERNYEKVKTFLSPKITGIGTGLSEYAMTPKDTLELYRKDLSEFIHPVEYVIDDIIVNHNTPNMGVVTGALSITWTVKGNVFSIAKMRFSFMVHKEEGLWKILHIHFSTPDNEQQDDEIFPAQNIILQNEILNRKVSERTKELQEANSRLQISNDTKEKLFSVISHDIRSPFNSLLGFIEILKDQHDDFDAEKHRKFIRMISESSNKIYTLLDNLLIWSNLQRDGFIFNPTAINLKEIVKCNIDLYRETIYRKRIEFINRINNAVFVLSDELMLSTIIRNLISNAIKFTHKNGIIIISVDDNISHNEDEITICIEDSGIGMSDEQINDLFTKDVNKSSNGTNQEKGTGLGLSICKEFIDLHKTKIWVESTPNIGSKFYFNLKVL